MFCLSSTLSADGFGWYAFLFDYKAFSQNYDDKLNMKFIQQEKANYSYLGSEKRIADWVVIEYLEANESVYAVESPFSFSGDLLSHQHLMFNVDFVITNYRATARSNPLAFFKTGRLMITPAKMVACKPQQWSLVHGTCRTAIVFTNKEAEAVYWQLVSLRKRGKSPAQGILATEFERLFRIFKEAAFKNKGIYFYGHD